MKGGLNRVKPCVGCRSHVGGDRAGGLQRAAVAAGVAGKGRQRARVGRARGVLPGHLCRRCKRDGKCPSYCAVVNAQCVRGSKAF